MPIKAIRHYPVTAAELAQIKVLTGDISKVDYRLFTHLLADSLGRRKRLQRETVPGFKGGGWIPILRRMIDDAFYVGKGKDRQRARPECLQEEGLIEIYDRYKPNVTARKYRIAPRVIEALEVASLSESINTCQPLFDLMTGKPWAEKWTAQPTIEEGRAISGLVERSIATIRQCHFNQSALAQHLESCRLAYHEACNSSNSHLAERLRQRIINDLAIYRNLPSHSPFRPTYYLQGSGRIGTSMQNLTGESKAAAYSGISDLHNYDLSSSQLRICRYYEFPRHGLTCLWLNDYLDDSTLRDSHAAAIGITPDTFKEAVIGVLMGSRPPRNGTDSTASILQVLCEGLPPDSRLDALEDVVFRFNDIIAPLKKTLNVWHRAIMRELEKEGGLSNALGLSLSLEHVKNHSGGSKRGTIAAHILQGTEALFVHTLTVLADSHGFQVVGNEHDGLITIGKIPPAAIRETQCRTGLEYLELREKPFGG